MRRGGTPFQPQFAFLALARRAVVSCQSSSGTMRRCGASIRCHSLRGLTRGRKIDRLTVRSRLAVNTAEAAADAATAGVGITRLLCYQVSNAVLDGRLKLVLRKFEPAPLPVSLVSPDAKLVPQKLKALVDFIGPRLKARLIFNP
jgi:DNA-binding transcriptional LysR family regulator